MKTALLVMVHGSPRPESNDDVQKVANLIRSKGAFHHVEVGFLECNKPDIPTAIDNCILKGAEGIVAAPYFLHTGNHVADDLPSLLEEAQRKYPKVQFAMSTYVGKSPDVTEVIADRARESTEDPSAE